MRVSCFPGGKRREQEGMQAAIGRQDCRPCCPSLLSLLRAPVPVCWQDSEKTNLPETPNLHSAQMEKIKTSCSETTLIWWARDLHMDAKISRNSYWQCNPFRFPVYMDLRKTLEHWSLWPPSLFVCGTWDATLTQRRFQREEPSSLPPSGSAVDAPASCF